MTHGHKTAHRARRRATVLGVLAPLPTSAAEDGNLARYLHHGLGYRTTGIDCSPGALASAAAWDTGGAPGPTWRCWGITTGDPG
ncbi:hypothetical protein [Streptomyces sp. NPDC093260]|uniref:hypothetical protein n=1 Tax=Streptomyces sp. NPDC093260 TaxID=3155073 RepID=UPI0034195D61